MPYIKREERYKFWLRPNANEVAIEPCDMAKECDSSGDLNYLITEILTEYMEKQGKNYQTLNEVIGVLECAKLEFYRRIVTPYENQKCEENGDVY